MIEKKEFDKFWYKGLLCELKSLGISGELYNLLENYLSGTLQWVVLNRQMSSERLVLAGVLQGSILGQLLFVVYINDLPDELKSNAKLFPGDTSLFTIVNNKSANILNDDLQFISKWAFNWKVLFNTDPSKTTRKVLSNPKSTNHKLK